MKGLDNCNGGLVRIMNCPEALEKRGFAKMIFPPGSILGKTCGSEFLMKRFGEADRTDRQISFDVGLLKFILQVHKSGQKLRRQ